MFIISSTLFLSNHLVPNAHVKFIWVKKKWIIYCNSKQIIYSNSLHLNVQQSLHYVLLIYFQTFSIIISSKTWLNVYRSILIVSVSTSQSIWMNLKSHMNSLSISAAHTVNPTWLWYFVYINETHRTSRLAFYLYSWKRWIIENCETHHHHLYYVLFSVFEFNEDVLLYW